MWVLLLVKELVFLPEERSWVSTGVNASVSASVYTSVLTSVYFVYVTGG